MSGHRTLFLIYVFTLFLLHALSPVPFLAPGFFLALGSLLLVVAHRGGVAQLAFRRDDALYGLIFLLGVAPLLFRPSRIGEQNIEYTSLWAAIWLISFWWVREWALVSKVRFWDISRAAAWGAAVLSIAVMVEFIMVNSTGYYLSDFIPFSVAEFPFANIVGTQFVRPRGMAVEAGFSAIVFECLMPLAIPYVFQKRLRLIIAAAVILPGYLLLGSAASLICFVLTYAIFLLSVNRSYRILLLGLAVALTAGLVFLFSDTAQGLYYEIIGRKVDALFNPMGANGISYSRSEAYRFGLRILAANPFGIGWGGISQIFREGGSIVSEVPKGSGIISLPLEIGVAGGGLALVLYFVTLMRKLVPLIRINTISAKATFFSLLWVALHHMVLLELWFPMFWFSLALADVVRIRATGVRYAVDEGLAPKRPARRMAGWNGLR